MKKMLFNIKKEGEMSQNLKKSKYIIKVILHNNHSLNRYLFRYITENQIKAITELIYNIWHLPLNKKSEIKNHIKLLKQFIHNKNKRQELLGKHYNFFSDLLHNLKKYINIIIE